MTNLNTVEPTASFDDDLHLLTPADIIFSMLERMAREGNFGVTDGHIWRKPEWTDMEINEYIERLKKLAIAGLPPQGGKDEAGGSK